MTESEDSHEMKVQAEAFWDFFSSLKQRAQSLDHWVGRPEVRYSRNVLVVETEKRQYHLLVYVSLAKPGFWGVTPRQLAVLRREPAWAVVLLDSETTGYLAPQFETDRFIRDKVWPMRSRQYKVHESTLPQELRFDSAADFVDLLDAVA